MMVPGTVGGRRTRVAVAPTPRWPMRCNCVLTTNFLSWAVGLPGSWPGTQAGFADVTIQNVPWGTLNPINRIFAKVVGPICGDLRLVSGIKPEQRA